MAKLYMKCLAGALLLAGSIADHLSYDCAATKKDIFEAEQKLKAMKEMGGTENHKKRVKDEIESLRKEIRANCERPTPAPTLDPTAFPTPAPSNYDCMALFSQSNLLTSEFSELKGNKDATEDMRKAKKQELNAVNTLIADNCGTPTLAPTPAPTVFTCPNLITRITKLEGEFDEIKGLTGMIKERRQKKEEIDELVGLFKSMDCSQPTPAPTSSACVDAIAAYEKLEPTIAGAFGTRRKMKKKELDKLTRKIKEDCLDMVDIEMGRRLMQNEPKLRG